MTTWKGERGCWISDDTSLLQVDRGHVWLSTLSWAQGRPRSVLGKAMARIGQSRLYDPQGAGGLLPVGHRRCHVRLAL
jgi:hypothetical protein